MEANNTPKYTLWFTGARKPATASSMEQALRNARAILGAARLYKGAEYVTDEPAGNGERRTVEAMDLWVVKRNANRQMSCSADCVVTWREVSRG